jgi:hypothetical protein
MALQGLLAGADPSKPPQPPKELAEKAHRYAVALKYTLEKEYFKVTKAAFGEE